MRYCVINDKNNKNNCVRNDTKNITSKFCEYNSKTLRCNLKNEKMKKFIRKIANEFLNEEVQNKILINIKNLIPEKNILDTIFKIISPKLHYKYEDLSNSSKNLIRVKKNIIHKLYKDF